MAFKASNQLPEDAYRRAKSTAMDATRLAGEYSTLAASGFNSGSLLSLFHDMRRIRDQLTAVKTVPGIAAHAKAQEDDAAYDVGPEFNTLIAAVDAVVQNILATFPTDGSGYLLDRKLTDGEYTYRDFAPAQLTTLKGLLDAIVNAVS